LPREQKTALCFRGQKPIFLLRGKPWRFIFKPTQQTKKKHIIMTTKEQNKHFCEDVETLFTENSLRTINTTKLRNLLNNHTTVIARSQFDISLPRNRTGFINFESDDRIIQSKIGLVAMIQEIYNQLTENDYQRIWYDATDPNNNDVLLEASIPSSDEEEDDKTDYEKEERDEKATPITCGFCSKLLEPYKNQSGGWTSVHTCQTKNSNVIVPPVPKMLTEEKKESKFSILICPDCGSNASDKGFLSDGFSLACSNPRCGSSFHICPTIGEASSMNPNHCCLNPHKPNKSTPTPPPKTTIEKKAPKKLQRRKTHLKKQ
jgi:hypothetical protein